MVALIVKRHRKEFHRAPHDMRAASEVRFVHRSSSYQSRMSDLVKRYGRCLLKATATRIADEADAR
jgi:hypothetical protein